MKHLLLASMLSTLAITGAHAQNTPSQKLIEQVEEFAQGPNSCNLFLGVDDSGFDGLTMDYADKLARLLSNDTRTPRETYALIYQRCLTRTTANGNTTSGIQPH
jgi:hypothetical protein